jgi:probable rRNA maturation factor
MNQLDIQIASHSTHLPTRTHFQTWIDLVLINPAEIVIRIVDQTESAELNQYYRHKQGATNILSFPFEAPKEIASALLGDLVICAPMIESQAKHQHKLLSHHWAHMVIHGVLHLYGYDHIKATDAQVMEAKEILLLKQLSIRNPYQEQISHE